MNTSREANSTDRSKDSHHSPDIKHVMTEAGEYRMSKKLASTLKKPGLIPINYDDFSDNSPPTKKELIDILIRE